MICLLLIIPTKDKVFLQPVKKMKGMFLWKCTTKERGKLRQISNMCVDQRMSKIYASIYFRERESLFTTYNTKEMMIL